MLYNSTAMFPALRRFTAAIVKKSRSTHEVDESIRNVRKQKLPATSRPVDVSAKRQTVTGTRNQCSQCGCNTSPCHGTVVEKLRRGKTAQDLIEIVCEILTGIFPGEDIHHVGLFTKSDDGYPHCITAKNTAIGEVDDHGHLTSHTAALWRQFLSLSGPIAMIDNDNPIVHKYNETPVGSGSSHWYRVSDYAAMIIVVSSIPAFSHQQEKSVHDVIKEFAHRLRQLEVEKWARIGVVNSKSMLLTSSAYEVQSASVCITALTSSSPVCVAFMDIDYFKDLNSKLTHLEADKVLRAVGQMIKETVSNCTRPESVVVGHIGGDEFMFTIIGNRKFAKTLMLDVLSRFANLLPEFSKPEVHEEFMKIKNARRFSASVGIAMWEGDADAAAPEEFTLVEEMKQLKDAIEEIRFRANKTLLKAKEYRQERSGRNVMFYDEIEE